MMATVIVAPTEAEARESWMADAEIDGFNLERAGEPDYLADFIELVVPELPKISEKLAPKAGESSTA